MAKVTVTAAVGDDVWFPEYFNVPMYAADQTKNEIDLVQQDESGLFTIKVYGENFKYHHGYLISGTLTGFDAEYDGTLYAHAQGVENSFKKTQVDLTNIVGKSLLETFIEGKEKDVGSNDDDFLHGIIGNDKLVGKGGADVLLASFGDTLMTGGKGSDLFLFSPSHQKFAETVTVTDFDAKGGGVKQDYIAYDPNSDAPRIYQDHHDTILDFGHHKTMVLLDVQRSDITSEDFKPFPDLGYLND